MDNAPWIVGFCFGNTSGLQISSNFNVEVYNKRNVVHPIDLFLSLGGDSTFVKMGVKIEFIASSFPSGWGITGCTDAEEANEEEPLPCRRMFLGEEERGTSPTTAVGQRNSRILETGMTGGGKPTRQQPRLDRKACGNAQAVGQL